MTPSMWSTILVPTDFSPASDAALALVARLAKEQGARVEILHVVELGGGLTPGTLIHPEGASGRVTVEQFVRDQTLPKLEEQTLRAGLESCDHRTFVAFGNPADTIVREALTCGADLIVLATHGRRGLQRWIVGSCTEAVVRRAPVPVLTVRVPSEEAKPTAAERALNDESVG